MIVNCMGLGSKYIFGDQDIYGVRGTLLEFDNSLQNNGMIAVNFEDEYLQLYSFKDKILVGLTR